MNYPKINSTGSIIDTSIAESLLKDIENRTANMDITSRIGKLTKCWKALGIALVLPLTCPPVQANEATVITTTIEAQQAGEKMATSMFEGAYTDWQERKKLRESRGPDIAGPMEPADIEAARKEFAIAVGTDNEAKKHIGENNPALRQAADSFTAFLELGTHPLSQAIREELFLGSYKSAVDLKPTTGAFDAVVREKCKEHGVPEPYALILEEPEIDM